MLLRRLGRGLKRFGGLPRGHDPMNPANIHELENQGLCYFFL